MLSYLCVFYSSSLSAWIVSLDWFWEKLLFASGRYYPFFSPHLADWKEREKYDGFSESNWLLLNESREVVMRLHLRFCSNARGAPWEILYSHSGLGEDWMRIRHFFSFSLSEYMFFLSVFSCLYTLLCFSLLFSFFLSLFLFSFSLSLSLSYSCVVFPFFLCFLLSLSLACLKISLQTLF